MDDKEKVVLAFLKHALAAKTEVARTGGDMKVSERALAIRNELAKHGGLGCQREEIRKLFSTILDEKLPPLTKFTPGFKGALVKSPTKTGLIVVNELHEDEKAYIRGIRADGTSTEWWADAEPATPEDIDTYVRLLSAQDITVKKHVVPQILALT